MRISDWSSDVCSSDLVRRDHHHLQAVDLMEFERFGVGGAGHAGQLVVQAEVVLEGGRGQGLALSDRKGVVAGKSVSVRVDFGGRRISKKKNLNGRQWTAVRRFIRTEKTLGSRE